VGLLLRVCRLLGFAVRFIYCWLPTILPTLFTLGAALTLMVYTPLPQHFCRTGQGYIPTTTQGGCNAMLALFDRFSYIHTGTQSVSGYITGFEGVRSASSTNALTFVTGGGVEPSPLFINDAIRRLVQVLFTLSIVWPRLLEPEKVLGGAPHGVCVGG